MLDRRRIDIACVQETKGKGSKAREIGDGYKLFYHGEKTSRNGVGIIISHKWKDNILAVNRMSDPLMSMQLVSKKGRLHVISAYAPQVGCTDQEKDSFWEGLDEVLQQIPDTEQVILAGDLNGHIGASREEFERWHGGNGYGEMNEEGRVTYNVPKCLTLRSATHYSIRRMSISSHIAVETRLQSLITSWFGEIT